MGKTYARTAGLAPLLRYAGLTLLLALAWQVASGALTNARLAGAACAAHCAQFFWLPGSNSEDKTWPNYPARLNSIFRTRVDLPYSGKQAA